MPSSLIESIVLSVASLAIFSLLPENLRPGRTQNAKQKWTTTNFELIVLCDMSLDHKVWNELKESSLITDPRFEAGMMSRQEGDYEGSIDFFAELLKTFESSETPLHLAPLYFNYGSSLVQPISMF